MRVGLDGEPTPGLGVANPRAQWHQYEAISHDNALAGSELAFNDSVETRYHFENADVIVSFDADFLTEGPGSARYARDFAKRREAPHIEGAAHGEGGEEHGEEVEGEEHGETAGHDADWTLNRL